MKKMMKSKKGFTLIELVIVIAILGVLAAVAITMFPKLSDSSREKADKTRATQIKNAIATYIAESGETDAGSLGADVDAILVSLQDGVETDATVDGPEYGPYLENVDGASEAESYYPQQDGKLSWDITVDPATGNVTVSSSETDGGSFTNS